MDKNTLMGLGLIALILIGFGFYSSKQSEKAYEQQRIKDSIEQARYVETLARSLTDTTSNFPATIQQPTKPDQEFFTLPAAKDTADVTDSTKQVVEQKPEFYTVENDVMKLTFTNKGGRIYSVEVKEFQTYSKKPLVLFTGDNNDFSLNFFTQRDVSTSLLYFNPMVENTNVVMGETDSTFVFPMRYTVDSKSYIEYLYKIDKNSYLIDFTISMVGMNKYIDKRTGWLDIKWRMDALNQEKNFENERYNSTVAYHYPGESSIEELSMRSDHVEQDSITARVDWIGFKQQFFSSILVADNAFAGASIRYTPFMSPGANNEIMSYYTNAQVTYTDSEVVSIPLKFYFGPNHYRTLKKTGDYSFERLVPLGWGIIGWINRWFVIPVFDFLSKYVGSFGIIILLMTILIKIIIFPLTHKSYMSTARMNVLKPEIEELNAKYPKQEDAMKKQQETMALYKRAGVNPMGGCIPMLIQFPILIAMFRFFPASFELRQQPFLWADDLSAYDSIIDLPFKIPLYGDHVSLFALLMAISMFFFTRMTMSQQPMTGQMQGMKFMSLYFMPLFMLVLCNNFSSGLSYYYLLSNIISMLQTFIVRRYFVDEEAIHKKMKERAKQPVKKSKWQERMEVAVKQQQEAQRKQTKRK